MKNLDITNNEIFSVFEINNTKTEVNYIAGFQNIDDAKDYCEYLSTINRSAWVYGHEPAPYKFLEDEAWVIDN